MADKIILAVPSKAYRFKIAVRHDQLTEAYNRCVASGLMPKPISLGAGDPSDIKIILGVVVPIRGSDNPQQKWVELESILEGTCINVMEGGWTDIVCPPAPEVCIIGGMEGMCPECRQYHQVIGPAYHLGYPRPVYVMMPHLASGKPGLCSGTGKDRLEESAT